MIWKNTIPGVVDSTASRFSETSTYKKSDYVWYVGTGVSPKLYKAKEDISAGVWDASKWEEIIVTNEFVSKDLIGSNYKSISEDFEGNQFGYRKYEAWYEFRPTSDQTATYNKGDIVYFEDRYHEWYTVMCTSDEPCSYIDIVYNGCSDIPFYRDWDTGEIIEAEGFTPVEGELYSCDDDDGKCFYKYSGGAYVKINPAGTIAEAKAAGFNPGDWFIISDNDRLRIAKFLTDNPSSEFVDVDLFDVAVCQNEVAKRLEDINPSDYYYGMPFYKDYQLYALLATTPFYEDVACEGSIDHDEFDIVHIGDVYAAKLNSINDTRKLFDGNSYIATQALIFNIWDARFRLPVPGINRLNNEWHDISIIGTPMTDDSSFYDNAPSMIILARQGTIYNVMWDLKGGSYTLTVDGFSSRPGGGEVPPEVNVNYLEVYNGDFCISDNTKNPDDEDYKIMEWYGALAFGMIFHNCRYIVYCNNKKGAFMPVEYEFYDCNVSFYGNTGDYILNFGGHSTGQTFTVVNSNIVVEADNSIEFEDYRIHGVNSRYVINSNELIFNDPIYISDLNNCEVSIAAWENIVLPSVGDYRGFFYARGRTVNNHIGVMTKWNATMKNKNMLYSPEDVAESGMFDNVFEFRDVEAPALTECPFKLDLPGRFIHMGNKIYVNQHGADHLIWHDYPGTDFHAEFIRALDKLTTQLGLTYTAIQDASGDYQYTFNLNN